MALLLSYFVIDYKLSLSLIDIKGYLGGHATWWANFRDSAQAYVKQCELVKLEVKKRRRKKSQRKRIRSEFQNAYVKAKERKKRINKRN